MVRTTARRLLVALSAVALVAWLAPSAGAQGTTTRQRTTYITFSQPVSLPGITLPAGTYIFQHLAPGIVNHRHVVQVLSKDRQKIYATLLAIPNTQIKPAGKPFVMFRERPANAPAAVQAWFYPGDTIGDEFVYPPQEARQIAEANKEPVLSSPAVKEPGQAGTATGENAQNEAKTLESAPVSRSGETSQRQMAENQSQPPANPSAGQTMSPRSQPPAPAPNEPSPNATPNPQATPGQTPSGNTPRRLPQTGSSLWLFGLLALVAPLGGVGLRLLRSQL